MTTIVIDYENQMVYADKTGTVKHDTSHSLLERIFIGNSSIDEVTSFVDTQEKIRRTSEGYLVTGAGCASTLDGFTGWPNHIPKVPKHKTTVVILFPCGGSVRELRYTCEENKSWWRPKKWEQEVTVENKGFSCIGSGGMYARGALEAGVHPRDAIKAASRVDFSTGFQVDERPFDYRKEGK